MEAIYLFQLKPKSFVLLEEGKENVVSQKANEVLREWRPFNISTIN